MPPTFARERVTVSTSVVTLTAATAKDWDMAEVTVDDEAIAFTLDGTAPVGGGGAGGVGHRILAGQGFTLLNKTELLAFKAIRDDAADAFLEVTYKKG